jgi:hypothetical protein
MINKKFREKYKYKYGIYTKIKDKDWTIGQIKMYMDNNGIEYEPTATREELIETIKRSDDNKNKIEDK